MERGLILSLMMLGLLSCSPAYRLQQYYSQTYYQDFPPSTKVSIYSFTESGLEELESQGYIILGHSSFNGPLQDQKIYQSFGKKIGVDIVLIKNTYTDTRQGSISLPSYSPGQTYNVTSSEHGTIGSLNKSYNYSSKSQSVITSPGTTSYQNVPIAVARYDQNAVYLRNSSNHAEKEKKKFNGNPLYVTVTTLFAVIVLVFISFNAG